MPNSEARRIIVETEAPDMVPLEALAATVKKRLELQKEDKISIDVIA